MVNIAIVMYQSLRLFGHLCGSLYDYKLIHLVRNPRLVAMSIAQMRADRLVYRDAYRAHEFVHEPAVSRVPFSWHVVERLVPQVAGAQRRFLKRFRDHRNVLSVNYEDLTGNREVSRLPIESSRAVLRFLGLAFEELTTTLRKTGANNDKALP
jgi:hypothetical protein